MPSRKIEKQNRVKVNVKEYLYALAEKNESNCAHIATHYYVYLAEVNDDADIFFIVSDEKLQLGEQELCLERIYERIMPVLNEKQLHKIFKAYPLIKTKTYQALAKMKRDNEDISLIDAFNDACFKLDVKQYARVRDVKYEELLKLTKEELQQYINLFVDGGYDIDPVMRELGIAGLIRFRENEKNRELMKYRPHALLIKPTKTGASKIFERIGKNISYLSKKSIEGHASADGDIMHSTLHNTWGSVNIDEFMQMDEELWQHAFNFVENGSFETHKASRKILNYGAPRLIFTTNPPDVEELKKTNGLDVGIEMLMHRIFLRCVAHLSQISGAAFSRFGLIIFEPKMQTAQLREIFEEEKEEEIRAVVNSLLEYVKKDNEEIFKKAELWLNTPIREYNEKIDMLIAKCENAAVRGAWEGQKDAYRHLRGHALSLALISNIYEILHKSYNIKDIIEDAEEFLTIAINRNLQSLNNILCLEATELSEDEISSQLQKAPGIYRAFLYLYLKAFEKTEETTTNFEKIEEIFKNLTEEEKEKLGEYRYWSIFVKKFNFFRFNTYIKNATNININFSKDNITKHNKLFYVLSRGQVP